MKYARKNVRRPRRRVPRKSAKPSRAFVKKVQKVIHKDAETKEAFTAFPITAFNSGINAAGDICQVLPNIAQFYTEGSRIGAEIRAQSLKLKGHMILSTSNASLANTRIAVRMMIVQPKFTSDFTTANFFYTYAKKERLRFTKQKYELMLKV